MLLFFYRGSSKRKAQVAPLIVLIMAALIGTIAATYLLGEVVLHRVKVANTVDAAAISSLAPLTRGLNQLRYVGQRMWLNWIQLQSALVVKMILYGGHFPDHGKAIHLLYRWLL